MRGTVWAGGLAAAYGDGQQEGPKSNLDISSQPRIANMRQISSAAGAGNPSKRRAHGRART